ncbi:carboxynorspermidine decarboxylase [bacterium]|nr:carboxynorspermidine decarboxylase [bacterium]
MLMRDYLDGVSASSLNEVLLGAEYFKKSIHTYSPAFDPSEIDHICRLSDHVVFNSLPQYHQFYSIAKRHNCRVGVRLNVEKTVTSYTAYDPSRRYSRFGVTKAELEKSPLSHPIDGLLVHNASGSDTAGLDGTLDSLEEKFSELLYQAEWLNLGGGNYITSPGYDVDYFISRIRYLSSKYNLQIILEPGYAVTCNTGYLCAKVMDVFTNEKNIAIVNVSPSTHFSFALEIDCPIDVLGQCSPGSSGHTYLVGGNTCLSADVIGEYTFETPLQPGDPFIMEDMVAYTMVRNTMFNGVHLPSIALLDEKNELTMLRESSYDNYKAYMN